MAKVATALDAVKGALGVGRLAKTMARLDADDIDLPKLRDLPGRWVLDFSVPTAEAHTIRPLLLSNYGKGKVHVPLVGAYDPVDIYTVPQPPIADLLNSRTGDDVTAQITEIVRRITTHLLYSDSVAVEYPTPARWIAHEAGGALRFMQFCTALEPLLETGALVLTPSMSDLGVQESERHFTTWPPQKDALVDQAMGAIGGRGRAIFRGYSDLDAANDPLGDLDGPYLEALRYNASDGVYEEEMRAARAYDRLEVMIDALNVSTKLPGVDLFASPQEVPLLKKLLEVSPEMRATGREADKVLAFAGLADLGVPVGRLKVSDLAAIRKSGEFKPFQEGLRRGLIAASNERFDILLDPRSAKLAEIGRAIAECRNDMQDHVNRSHFLRTHLNQSGDLVVASVAGLGGAYAQSPALGAGIGAATYLAEKLFQWVKARGERHGDAFKRHLSVFSPPK